MIEKNNVSALRQIQNKNRVEIVDNAGKTRVLFVGNSITRHEPKPEIGWINDWGMAAFIYLNSFHFKVGQIAFVHKEMKGSY